MLRSLHEQEHEMVLKQDHVEEVWLSIAESFPRYFERYVSHSVEAQGSPVDQAVAMLASKYKVKETRKEPGPALRARFRSAIDEYQREADLYRSFFNEENLQEYAEMDAQEFKRALRERRNCPIINKCINSKRETMHEWQREFKARDPRELRSVFRELYLAAEDYAAERKPANYEVITKSSDLGLEQFDEDENLRAPGIIGTGIKSAVLYHLHPDIFPPCDSPGLYALYFMSGHDKHFGLPSNTNEFIMINDLKPSDRINDIDRNYWYPYSLYSLYQVRLHRLLVDACSKLKVDLDPKYRFVYNEQFLAHVTDVPPESELLDATHAPREELW